MLSVVVKAPKTLEAEPAPIHVVDSAEQLKAFTDPLRNRILAVFTERAATNRQVAEHLGEPEAKVLYHVRFLCQAGLVRLVEERVKGGNVEKYYRAIARMFSLRPGPELYADLIDAGIETVRQEVSASMALWPDQRRWFESRGRRIPAERLAEFVKRMRALIAEYWEGPEDRAAPRTALVALTYRDPADVRADAGPKKRSTKKGRHG